jgi:cytochrome c-type biogenesis protein CcmH
VIIGARVSHGGDAIASSGDLQGFSAPVKVGSSGVQVQIDQVVP